MWDIREQSIPLKASNNIMMTQGLFYEFQNPDAPYTLKNQDVTKGDKTYVSIYRVYMESADEYEAAMRIVGSMQHWRKLCSQAWFLEGIDAFSWEGIKQAREDMAARDKSLAKKQLLEAASEGNVTAMKTVYGDAPKQVAGRKPKNQLSKVDTSVESAIVANISKLRASDG